MSDPNTIPARLPPPGYTSNLINPHSTGYQQTICNVICVIFVTLFVGMRIYTRIRLVKCVSWDDYLITLATLVFYADVGLFQYIVKVGLGKHLWDVSAASFSPTFLEVWTFAAVIYSISMLFIKMDLTVEADRCIDKKAFYIGNGVMNIISSISCVISLVRLLSIITWIRVGDTDITYTLQSIVVWSEIELSACIICANAPCLRPFFTTHLPFLSLSAHTNHSSSKTGNPSQIHQYPTTIGGKRSRAISPYPNDMDAIFDGTQDVELENYDVESSAGGSVGEDQPKHSYAKHGYKTSTGNKTIVSVTKAGSRGGGSRGGSFDDAEDKRSVGVGRQQSLRSIGEERRGRILGDRAGSEFGEEGVIVVHTSYHVQTVREDV
ncbi:hypothetical protein D6D13_10478 [Aureobasidium pullulans]|uniref:Rhodopsin domain-containing protein n=1 Tax=Aureobasidium pullulans TaxID=5580 RepID=A0A4S9BY23_AURPU|nr:hypothetical protein D6D13_10478 [Aureobasidium pullulans]